MCDDFDDEIPPPVALTGSVYDLVGKPRRGRKRKIGFVIFPEREAKKPKPVARKPRKARRK